MTHKEFFDVLVGNPPPQIELEIEIRKREVEALPEFVMKQYCLDLVKENKLPGAKNCAFTKFRNSLTKI